MPQAAVAAVSIVATVVSGVMAMQQAKAAARAQEQQAQFAMMAAIQENRVRDLQIEQLAVEQQSEENKLREEAIERRRRAYSIQQTAYAQQAGRGLMAIGSYGSFGRILEDSEEELWRDLEANRIQRRLNMARYLTERAGLAAAKEGAMRGGAARAAGFEAQADATRMGGFVSMLSTVGKVAQIWPTTPSGAKT